MKADSQARYREKNREALREKNRAYARARRQNLAFRIAENIKTREARVSDPTWRARAREYKARWITKDGVRKHVAAYNKNYGAGYRGAPGYRDRQNAYFRNRLAEDEGFRLRLNLSTRIRIAIRKQLGLKARKTMQLIGCTIHELRAHLEEQFEPWMSWDNYGSGDGKWCIDHIRPCASFDLTNEAEQLACFNWKNLQPLCWKKNLQKRDFYCQPQTIQLTRQCTYHN